jgi:hypothetical protein
MSPSKINREWHEAHRMPARPTRQQRMDWHIEHSTVCKCRAPTAKLQAEIEAYVRETAGDGAAG